MAALNPSGAKGSVEQASPADRSWETISITTGPSAELRFRVFGDAGDVCDGELPLQFDRADTYDWYLGLGALANADEKYFHGKVPTWTDFTRHPNYDSFWQRQAFAPYLTGVKLPILHVAGWWDQEDFYGPQKIYELLERHDPERRNYFVAGPWNHGGWNGNGKKLGAIDFGSDTAAHYREKIFQPWFDHWLRGEGLRGGKLAEATVFETGRTMKEHDSCCRSAAWRRGVCISARASIAFDGPGGAG
jgi:predicted acyl esterase